MNKGLMILLVIFFIALPVLSSEFDAVKSARMSVGIGYQKSTSLIKADTTNNDTTEYMFDIKSSAMCELPIDSLIPILKRGNQKSPELLGNYMDGPANDTYIELYYSDTKREVIHFSSDNCFNFASITPSRFYFTQIRDNDPEIDSSLLLHKRENWVIYFSKEDQVKLYNLISKYRRMGLGLKDTDIREIELKEMN